MLSRPGLHPADRSREEGTEGLFLPRLVRGTRESSRKPPLLQASLKHLIHTGELIQSPPPPSRRSGGSPGTNG